MSMRLAIRSGLAVLILAVATGAAFAAWMESGPRMLLSLSETGLSWCF